MANPLGIVGGPAVTFAEEEAVFALLRPRLEGQARRRFGAPVLWTRPERSAEGDDFRARSGLGRAAAERLPSGRPWRGEVRSGRWFRRTRFGASIAFAVSWSGLSRGKSGAITVAEAIACFERERENWSRRHGSRPFYAAVAGVFREPVGSSPLDHLAFLAWEEGAWRFRGRESEPELAELFFPAPMENSSAPARWQGMGEFCDRLLSPFRSKHRRAEARLAARIREFQEARRVANQLRDECARHAAAGDWTGEWLEIQQASAREAGRRAQLLHRRVASLQENVQLLTTAEMGGALIADSGLPIDAGRLESLDRSYFGSRARREDVVEAERTLSGSLLGQATAKAAPIPECEA